jgi:hypothetical protein
MPVDNTINIIGIVAVIIDAPRVSSAAGVGGW